MSPLMPPHGGYMSSRVRTLGFLREPILVLSGRNLSRRAACSGVCWVQSWPEKPLPSAGTLSRCRAQTWALQAQVQVLPPVTVLRGTW